ncbi:MAG: efflux RND transporter periplasmic adaptor subunit [Planctomycetaceae bacterium]
MAWFPYKALGLAVAFAATGYGGYLIGFRVNQLRTFDSLERHPKQAETERESTGVEITGTNPRRLKLNAETLKSLKIRVAAAAVAPKTEPLVLSGSLFLDSSHLAIVHTRFAGELVRIGEVPDTSATNGEARMRQLRAGDHVKKNDVIAVIWSKEIGEKKSDLVEALSRSRASRITLDRLESLKDGTVAEHLIRDARRQSESDLIAIERAERTLRAWKETDAEIAEVHAEANRISRGESPKDSHVAETWANVEIRAPLDGVILERNVSIGEILDTNVDMFKIADMNRMGVLANIYEEDIPRLMALDADQRQWKVRLKSEPKSEAICGAFEVIGHVIDPGQHTAAVIGWIKNSGQRLRTGQFITATIDLPATDMAVSIPNASIIDDGLSSTVFVATDKTAREIEVRKVDVLRRGRDYALVKRHADKNPEKGNDGGLHEGEFVVTSGNLELFGAVQDQPSAASDEDENREAVSKRDTATMR